MPYMSEYRRRWGYSGKSKSEEPAPEGYVKLPALDPYGPEEKETMKQLAKDEGIMYRHYGDWDKAGWYCPPLTVDEVIAKMPKGRAIPREQWEVIPNELAHEIKKLNIKGVVGWKATINPNMVNHPEVQPILESIRWSTSI
jgi:hypothetical protein